jgi:A/G-specific adenine glycosylase
LWTLGDMSQIGEEQKIDGTLVGQGGDPSRLREALLAWWERYGRDFPWRKTRSAYHVLVAEALLHRTRANQVVGLYEKTLAAYPTVYALAAAEPEAVYELLHSAGLRWRVGLLLNAAQEIVDRFSGEVPASRVELESIPGIGHYIAAAIRCFAFGENDAIIDSNVVRVYGRVFDLRVTDSLRRNRDFHQLAQSLVDPEHPREYNLALLDLAAAICTPRVPKCEVCPIAVHCTYGRNRLGISPPQSHDALHP